MEFLILLKVHLAANTKPGKWPGKVVEGGRILEERRNRRVLRPATGMFPPIDS